jgi:hypothetical protein
VHADPFAESTDGRGGRPRVDVPGWKTNLAPARPSVSITPDGRHQRLEFDFGRNRGSGWLARNGEMLIDTWVQHRGLFCAEYEVGLRFGVGLPGCTGVRWVSGVRWLARRDQCNNAIVNQIGGDTDETLAAAFETITCAERIVQCSGRNC